MCVKGGGGWLVPHIHVRPHAHIYGSTGSRKPLYGGMGKYVEARVYDERLGNPGLGQDPEGVGRHMRLHSVLRGSPHQSTTAGPAGRRGRPRSDHTGRLANTAPLPDRPRRECVCDTAGLGGGVCRPRLGVAQWKPEGDAYPRDGGAGDGFPAPLRGVPALYDDDRAAEELERNRPAARVTFGLFGTASRTLR